VLAVRPGITDPASLAYIDEARLLAAAADPEREYIEVILPAKLAACRRLCRARHAGGPTWRAVAHAARCCLRRV
jgi:hypothetical protein